MMMDVRFMTIRLMGGWMMQGGRKEGRDRTGVCIYVDGVWRCMINRDIWILC
jgi:hypothetical protein